MPKSYKLGTALRNARQQKNITQEKAAELAEVCVETIRNIESNKTTPKIYTVLLLWDIYGIPKAKLWLFKPQPKEK